MLTPEQIIRAEIERNKAVIKKHPIGEECVPLPSYTLARMAEVMLEYLHFMQDKDIHAQVAIEKCTRIAEESNADD